ncbi:MAG: hypothetical protein K2I95_11485 [Treponemataceae bacterium]|nr:hypothetical protein [Treponemataceae bacterium]
MEKAKVFFTDFRATEDGGSRNPEKPGFLLAKIYASKKRAQMLLMINYFSMAKRKKTFCTACNFQHFFLGILFSLFAFGIRESAFQGIGGRCVRGIPYAAAF